MVVIESQEHLSAWLTKELSPICDADPAALAKYVLALLRKPDKSDEQLKEVCLGQLDVFLQTNTRRFVESLFTALDKKSYLPAVPDPAPPVEQPVPEKEKREERTDDKERRDDREKREDRKRRDAPKEKDRKEASAKSTNQEPVSSSSKDTRKPATTLTGSNSAPLGKRAELSDSQAAASSSSTSNARRGGSPIRPPRRRISPPPPDKPRRRSRSPLVEGRVRRVVNRRSPVERHRKEKRSHSRSRSRSPTNDKERRRERERDDEPRKKKQRCRDYDEKGFCMRGEQCQFDHGPDPVVVDDSALAKIVGGKPPVVGPPHSFHVPPPGYNPLPGNPPPPGVEGYNPEAPGLCDFSVPPPPLVPAAAWRPAAFNVGPIVSFIPPPPSVDYDPTGCVPVDPHSSRMMGGNASARMIGRGRGRGRGFHPYRPQVNAPPPSDEIVAEKIPANVAARTLIVKRIPPEQNSIAKLHEHFGQFGTIVNLQVHYEGLPDTALITFASRFEATQAFKNPEPILNNRFIRVFWYTNMAEQPGPVEGGTKTTTLSSGITVETPVEPRPVAAPRPKQPIVLPGPGQTSYKNPDMLEAKKIAKQKVAEARASQEKRLRLSDLHRRATTLLRSLNEQLKSVIGLLMKETDGEKKKKLTKMYKHTENQVALQKKEVENLSAKLAELSDNAAAPVKKEDSESGNEIASSSPDERESVSPPATLA